MARFKRATFENETVTLDGNEYLLCTFVKCTIVFGATGPVGQLAGNDFQGCKWGFTGAAQDTVKFLQTLHADRRATRKIAARIIKDIQQGTPIAESSHRESRRTSLFVRVIAFLSRASANPREEER